MSRHARAAASMCPSAVYLLWFSSWSFCGCCDSHSFFLSWCGRRGFTRQTAQSEFARRTWIVRVTPRSGSQSGTLGGGRQPQEHLQGHAGGPLWGPLWAAALSPKLAREVPSPPGLPRNHAAGLAAETGTPACGQAHPQSWSAAGQDASARWLPAAAGSWVLGPGWHSSVASPGALPGQRPVGPGHSGALNWLPKGHSLRGRATSKLAAPWGFLCAPSLCVQRGQASCRGVLHCY